MKIVLQLLFVSTLLVTCSGNSDKKVKVDADSVIVTDEVDASLPKVKQVELISQGIKDIQKKMLERENDLGATSK